MIKLKIARFPEARQHTLEELLELFPEARRRSVEELRELRNAAYRGIRLDVVDAVGLGVVASAFLFPAVMVSQVLAYRLADSLSHPLASIARMSQELFAYSPAEKSLPMPAGGCVHPAQPYGLAFAPSFTWRLEQRTTGDGISERLKQGPRSNSFAELREGQKFTFSRTL